MQLRLHCCRLKIDGYNYKTFYATAKLITNKKIYSRNTKDKREESKQITTKLLIKTERYEERDKTTAKQKK